MVASRARVGAVVGLVLAAAACSSSPSRVGDQAATPTTQVADGGASAGPSTTASLPPRETSTGPWRCVDVVPDVDLGHARLADPVTGDLIFVEDEGTGVARVSQDLEVERLVPEGWGPVPDWERRRLYVRTGYDPDAEGSTYAIVDLDTGAVTPRTSDRQISGGAVDPDSGMWWANTSGGGTTGTAVAVVDPSSGAVLQVFDDTISDHSDDHHRFFDETFDRVFVGELAIDTTTLELLQRLPFEVKAYDATRNRAIGFNTGQDRLGDGDLEGWFAASAEDLSVQHVPAEVEVNREVTVDATDGRLHVEDRVIVDLDAGTVVEATDERDAASWLERTTNEPPSLDIDASTGHFVAAEPARGSYPGWLAFGGGDAEPEEVPGPWDGPVVDHLRQQVWVGGPQGVRGRSWDPGEPPPFRALFRFARTEAPGPTACETYLAALP